MHMALQTDLAHLYKDFPAIWLMAVVREVRPYYYYVYI
jgi:hypothetical protein